MDKFDDMQGPARYVLFTSLCKFMFLCLTFCQGIEAEMASFQHLIIPCTSVSMFLRNLCEL